MENVLLAAAAAACGLASVLSFIPKCKKIIPIMLWCFSSCLILACAALMAVYLAGERWDYVYVYSHTSAGLPLLYRISALWSGQEGSFLLWSAVSAVTGFFLLRRGRAFGVYAAVSFFIFVMCCVSQPFAVQAAQPNGLGMAEALRDPWMAVHPPLVFMAYSSMAALASLPAAAPQSGTAQRIKKWSRISWALLGLGILTGSVWAYRALGWGGYWAWDPIENAALVPWLVLCGYLHSRDKQTPAMCVIPFTLACLGTFMTRSGILKDSSAHAYTEGNALISVSILVLVTAALCWAAIYKIRRNAIKRAKQRFLNSLKDAGLLFVRVIYAYAFLIAAGTAAPLVTHATTPEGYYTIISVIFVILCSVLLLLKDKEFLVRRGPAMLLVSTALAIAAAAAAGCTDILLIILLWICLMPPCLWLVSGFKNSAGYYILHIGMALLVIGAVVSSGFGTEAYAAAPQSAGFITIEGASLPTAGLSNNGVIILSSVFKDVIVNAPDAFMMPDGGIAVPYVTKPLILLFWAGGLMTILSPGVLILLKKLRRKKQTERTQP